LDYGTTTGSAAVKAVPAPAAVPARPRLRVDVWLLVVVLVVQAGLSLRLVGADSAFQDEAAYLWAGHLEWSSWLHGGALPPFAAYFSGSPVVYPPLGAVADSVGGLAGARVLSLVFMLGATGLLWGVAGRLFGRRAAFFAAVLFGVSGPVVHLGSFATYDALAVLLVAVASWCVVRAGEREDATGWMVAAGVALALANATAYSSALVDPVVLVLALVVAFPRPGGKAAWGRFAILIAVVAVLLTGGMLLGGDRYAHGVRQTTLYRIGGADAISLILGNAWAWTGLVAVIAVVGVLYSALRGPRLQTWTLALLAVAIILVPAEQARIHTAASLNKHVVLGLWFAAVAAGFAVDRLVGAASPGRVRMVTLGACVVALAFPLELGAVQSRSFATAWPDSFAYTSILRPLTGQGGRLLVEDPSVAEYYLPAGHDWQRWSSTRNIVLPSGLSTGGPTPRAGVVGAGNAGTFAAFISEGYFKYVALNYTDTTALDHQLTADLRRNRHYRIIDVVPYGTTGAAGTYIVWRYETQPSGPVSYQPRLNTPAEPGR
jgi:hypothetical protein